MALDGVGQDIEPERLFVTGHGNDVAGDTTWLQFERSNARARFKEVSGDLLEVGERTAALFGEGAEQLSRAEGLVEFQLQRGTMRLGVGLREFAEGGGVGPGMPRYRGSAESNKDEKGEPRRARGETF